MATQYEFKELERQITTLEKDLAKFEDSFASTISTISNARFNENEYGERAITKKVSEIVDRAKRKISSIFNDYVNGIRRASFESAKTVKNAANDAAAYIEKLNSRLKILDSLNSAFSEKRYRFILQTDIKSEDFPAEISKYVTYLKLESYDAICKKENQNVSIANYCDFYNYYLMCKKSIAMMHLPIAAELLFKASCSVCSVNTSLSEGHYKYCINGLQSYKDMSKVKQDSERSRYLSFYKQSIELYNKLCEKAYSEFDYILVKSLLQDSSLFQSNDISNEFFKDGIASPAKLYLYAKKCSKGASREIMATVFDDTKMLAAGTTLHDYLNFWISRYDDYGYYFVHQIMELQKDQFETQDLLCSLLLDCKQYIFRYGHFLLDAASAYEEYLCSISTCIPLLPFLKTSIKWNKQIHHVPKFSDTEEQECFDKAAKILDGLSYSMILKYQKYCSSFDERTISELNNVLNDASTRLFGKPCKKILRRSDKAKASAETVTVKLVSVEIQNKKKRNLIFLFCAIGAVAAIIAAIVIILNK